MTSDEMLNEMQSHAQLEIFSPNLTSISADRGITRWVENSPWSAECQFYIRRENGTAVHGARFTALTFHELVTTIYNEWKRLE